MACDYTSNSCFNKYALSGKGDDGFRQWEAGYRAIDRHIKDLLDLVEEKGLRNQHSFYSMEIMEMIIGHIHSGME